MGYAAGSQNFSGGYTPYVDGTLWVDQISRTGNSVYFSVNVSAHVVGSSQAYWNWPWYVDCICGPVVWRAAKLKPRTNGPIAGIENWLSINAGDNFRGTVSVGGQDTSIVMSTTFDDGAGHRGPTRYWRISIPAATPMSDISASVSAIDTTSATITGSVAWKGDYSKITKWAITCNGQTRTLSGDNMSYSVPFLNLEPDTNYNYKIQVWNSSGFTKTYSGSFKTKEDEIGYLVIEDQPVKVLTGWVITPDGKKSKIRRIATVDPL